MDDDRCRMGSRRQCLATSVELLETMPVRRGTPAQCTLNHIAITLAHANIIKPVAARYSALRARWTQYLWGGGGPARGGNGFHLASGIKSTRPVPEITETFAQIDSTPP